MARKVSVSADPAKAENLAVDATSARRIRDAIREGFSQWCRWPDRADYPDVDACGIYLLGHFDRRPRGTADPASGGVIYIGETRTSFTKRWKRFHRSASTEKWAHSGGRTYFRKFSGVRSDLYVAALPVRDLAGRDLKILVKLYESKLLCDYLLKHGRLPACNTMTTR